MAHHPPARCQMTYAKDATTVGPCRTWKPPICDAVSPTVAEIARLRSAASEELPAAFGGRVRRYSASAGAGEPCGGDALASISPMDWLAVVGISSHDQAGDRIATQRLRRYSPASIVQRPSCMTIRGVISLFAVLRTNHNGAKPEPGCPTRCSNH